MLTQKISRFFYIGLIFLIIISAHWGKDVLNYPMQTLGLDLPMTPFTADMDMMLAKEEHHEAYYTKNFIIWYQTGFNDFHSMKVEDLGWYEFKAPFQWWSECIETNRQCPIVLYYLCRSLESYVKLPILSWRIEMIQSQKTKPVDGLGLDYKCPLK